MKMLEAVRLAVEKKVLITHHAINDLYAAFDPHRGLVWNDGAILDFRADNMKADWRVVPPPLPETIHVAVYVEGGVALGFYSNYPVHVHLVDADDLKEEWSAQDIQDAWDNLISRNKMLATNVVTSKEGK